MAKKIKNSKFNVTGQDLLTEITYGKGAITLNDCRIVMREGSTACIDTDDGEKQIKRMGIYGVAVNTPNIVNGDGKLQMWDCEIIIIPKKKYRNGFDGKRADQILCSQTLGSPECWEEEIFDVNDE